MHSKIHKTPKHNKIVYEVMQFLYYLLEDYKEVDLFTFLEKQTQKMK